MSGKLIALDAGHGMYTIGKQCLKSLDPKQTKEWWLNDRIADMVEGELNRNYNCRVLRVDDTTGAKDISLSARVKAANNAGADLYLSIHHNAGIGGGNGGGTVVYYWSTDAKRTVQAKRLYDLVVCRTKLQGNRSSKVIKKGFYVVKNTKMPAFLIENGFMDSRTDIPVILTAEHAEKTARGIVEFLAEMLQLTKQGAAPEPEKPAGSGSEISSGGESGAYYSAYTGKKTTLSAALTGLGINSTYAHRKKIAVANSIRGYTGTAAQNTQMYNLLVAGRLKKV